MLRLIFFISMIIAIILAITIGLTSLLLINKYRKIQLQKNFTESHLQAFNSENHNKLLTNLKKQNIKQINDEELIYILNTITRNQYQKSCLIGFDSNYELETLIKTSNQKIDCEDFEFLLINYQQTKKTNQIKDSYEKINSGGMIFVVNLPRKSLINSEIWDFFQENKIRFDYERVGKGIIIIAK